MNEVKLQYFFDLSARGQQPAAPRRAAQSVRFLSSATHICCILKFSKYFAKQRAISLTSKN
jgi:hypothetical protein